MTEAAAAVEPTPARTVLPKKLAEAARRLAGDKSVDKLEKAALQAQERLEQGVDRALDRVGLVRKTKAAPAPAEAAPKA